MDPSISNMRALVKENSTEGYELKEIPVPTIEADEILFKVERVAICGSDIALYLWNEVAKVIGTIPFIPGDVELIRNYHFYSNSNLDSFRTRSCGNCCKGWLRCC